MSAVGPEAESGQDRSGNFVTELSGFIDVLGSEAFGMRQSSGALELQSHRRASLQICGRPKERRQRTAAVQNLADLQEAQILRQQLANQGANRFAIGAPRCFGLDRFDHGAHVFLAAGAKFLNGRTNQLL